MARKTLKTQLDELAAVNVQLHTDLMLAEQERDEAVKAGDALAESSEAIVTAVGRTLDVVDAVHAKNQHLKAEVGVVEIDAYNAGNEVVVIRLDKTGFPALSIDLPTSAESASGVAADLMAAAMESYMDTEDIDDVLQQGFDWFADLLHRATGLEGGTLTLTWTPHEDEEEPVDATTVSGDLTPMERLLMQDAEFAATPVGQLLTDVLVFGALPQAFYIEGEHSDIPEIDLTDLATEINLVPELTPWVPQHVG